MQVHNTVSQAELLKIFADFTNENRMDRTFTPQAPKTPIKTEKEIKKDKFERKYGVIFTGAAALAGAGILTMLLRGGKFGGLTKFAQKYYTKLAAETMEAKRNIQNLPFTQKLQLKAKSAFVACTEKCESLGNLNPIKDIAFDRTAKFLHIKPFFDKITKIFVSISKKITKNQYLEPKICLNNFEKTLNLYIEKIRKTNPELAETISKKFMNMSGLLDDISKGADSRFDEVIQTLNKKISVSVGGKNIERTQVEDMFLREPLANIVEGFIPAKNIYPLKKQLFRNLHKTKQQITNNVVNLSETLNSSIDDIFKKVAMEKDEARNTYFKLKDLIQQFKNSANSQTRNCIKEELLTELNKAKTLLSDKPYQAMLSATEELLANSKPGAIEDIVSLCKKFSKDNPELKELYKKLKKERNAFQDSLNNAVSFETEKTFNKMVDYSLHSLSTDMITQSLGLGVFAHMLASKKKSTDEKISGSLKGGIPLIGGLLTMFACNVRQVASGPSALFIGFLSTIILNRLGTFADKKYQANLLAKKNAIYLKSQASS